MTKPPPPDLEDPPPALGRMRALGRVVLTFERVWPEVAPALGVLGVLLCLALLDIPRRLPAALHIALLVLGGLAVVAVLGRGLRRVVLPRAAEIDRRLETDSGLRHQPLAVLADRPASDGGALWRAHVARARAQISRLRLDPPRPMLAAIDRKALRALIVVAVIACLGIAGPDSGLRLAAAFHPARTEVAPPPEPVLQAWITPPAFTGLPPIFLRPDTTALTIPEGSRLAASLTGGTDRPSLVLDSKTTPFTALDATSFQIEQDLTTGGHLAVRRGGREVAGWTITVVADIAPTVSFPEPPSVAKSGPTPLVRIPWEVAHAYGVAGLEAHIHLRDRAEAPPLTIAIPLPGNAPKTGKGARTQDLTAHPWAGLPVTIQLTARDTQGLEGSSTTETMTLPERRFLNPVAKALVEVRKRLSAHPEDRRIAVSELDRIAQLPEVWDDDMPGYVNLRAIMSMLRRSREPDAIEASQSRLWELALHVEEGAVDRTARALETARQAVRESLDAQKRGEKIDKAELDRRMRELKEALQKRLDALSEQARRDPGGDRYDPDQHPLDKRDMQNLADQARESARQDKMDEARDEFAELDKMMQALQESRPEHGKMTEQERQRAEKRQRGEQQMTALQDMVQREGGLLDHAQSRAQSADMARRPPNAQRGAKDDPAARAADQRIQNALRRAVGELMQDYSDLTGKVPPNLDDADTAMREAGQAMADGRDAQAAAAAQRAIEALQKGGQAMQQQMARQFGRGQQGDQGDEGEGTDEADGGEDGMGQDGNGPAMGGLQPGMQEGDGPGTGPNRGRNGKWRSSRQSLDRDPLGRQRGDGTGGLDESADVQVPDQMEEARTRALQDELRRRGADRTRPQGELEYIERLLKQF